MITYRFRREQGGARTGSSRTPEERGLPRQPALLWFSCASERRLAVEFPPPPVQRRRGLPLAGRSPRAHARGAGGRREHPRTGRSTERGRDGAAGLRRLDLWARNGLQPHRHPIRASPTPAQARNGFDDRGAAGGRAGGRRSRRAVGGGGPGGAGGTTGARPGGRSGTSISYALDSLPPPRVSWTTTASAWPPRLASHQQ